MEPESSLVLQSKRDSALLARKFVQRALADTSEEVKELAALGVSELVANVVLHTDCDAFRLTVDRDPHGLRVEVHDDNPAPVVYREAETDAEGGRGLQIISSLSSRWGVSRREGDGKSVWFRLENS